MPSTARRIVLLATAGLGLVAAAQQTATGRPAVASSKPQLSIRAAVLNKTSSSTWTGKARSKQLGAGTLTLRGKVRFRTDGQPASGTVRFRATFAHGFVSGCLHNGTILRPGDRQVWDGPGQITDSSASLKRLRGVLVRGGGVSQADDLDHARPFSIATGDGPGKACA
jgi:hypothetical protein